MCRFHLQPTCHQYYVGKLVAAVADCQLPPQQLGLFTEWPVLKAGADEGSSYCTSAISSI